VSVHRVQFLPLVLVIAGSFGWPSTQVAQARQFTPSARPTTEDDRLRATVAAADAVVIADVVRVRGRVQRPYTGRAAQLYEPGAEIDQVTWLKGAPRPLRYIAQHRLLPASIAGQPPVRPTRFMLFLEQPSTIPGSGLDPAVFYVNSDFWFYGEGAVALPSDSTAAALTRRVRQILRSQTIPALAVAADAIVYGTGLDGVVCNPYGTPVTCPRFHVESSLKGSVKERVLEIFSAVPCWSPTERHALLFLKKAPANTFEILQSPAGAIEFGPDGLDREGVSAASRLSAVRATIHAR